MIMTMTPIIRLIGLPRTPSPPCILISVVNCGHMGATDRSPPGSCRDRRKVLVVAPLTRSGRSPNGCQGRGSLREARICKVGPHRGRRSLVKDRAESRYYVGVDVS